MNSELKLRKIVRANLIISFMGILFFGFQNCSEVQFSDDFSVATFEGENPHITTTMEKSSNIIKEDFIK
jgi:hypothetical protein